MSNPSKHNGELPESHWTRIYLIILGFNAFLVIVFYILRLIFNHPVA